MTQPFGPGELDGVEDVRPDDLAAEARVARELEGIGGRTGAAFSADFVDRVMASVEAEPVPAPARAAGHALRHGAIGAFLASFADAWRVTTRSGFPVAVRAQALALVLVVVGLAAGSGVATAGALGFMQGEAGVPSPQPSIDVPPTPDGNSAPSMPPRTEEPTMQPPASMEPVATDETPTEPADTHKPDSTAGDDKGGGAGSGDDKGGRRTPKPTRSSGGSGGGDDGDDDGHGNGDDHSGPGGGGDDDEDATETPEPTETPDDDGSEHGGSSSES